ncbi:TIGR04282 family arsenosugar biosynthesis glycosyltransferase [Roseomonas sp. PWR1]|uniref:TIGR04282 family arsenosugar biosynthesis glycosyltransferase n=1 Tax=Roseomonas nitratireducens TaxID=2820810 RepID=A0ABS4AXS1_9PROT|nr:TIGR04282 family arsenosugar biosynthesis glycosyltransferase [Neoroseomonas nitratireducens]MBP0465357.1 TIGR04282 family arsenosugar biosynthesis glycosyltransferase [Neoroseomonas nitratireducens]
MTRPTVILFARAPRLGAVKRRLARGIGDRAALRFYAGTLAAVARPIARDARWRTLLATTPRGARADWARFAPRGTRRVAQPLGDLGARMAGAMRAHPVAVLAGTDVPDLRPSDIAAAIRALGRADAVFGPAEDGGYWLVGMGPRRPARPFAGVRWSTRHALADTLRNFAGRRVALLRVLRDVDTAEDLRARATLPPPRPPCEPSAPGGPPP